MPLGWEYEIRAMERGAMECGGMRIEDWEQQGERCVACHWKVTCHLR